VLAISGDIISEVAAAADPIRAAAARRRLEALSNDSVGHFASLVEPSQRPLSKPLAAHAPATVTPPPRSVSPRRQGSADPVASAYQALGGVLLQKTFEAMMPKLAGLSGANSSASSIWSSMLAQQLAESVSASVFHLSRGPAIAAPFQAVAIGGAVARNSTET